MYYFALSLVPKLNRLFPRNPTRAQIHVWLTCMADLEVEDEGQRQHATEAHIMFPSSQHPPTVRNKPIAYISPPPMSPMPEPHSSHVYHQL